MIRFVCATELSRLSSLARVQSTFHSIELFSSRKTRKNNNKLQTNPQHDQKPIKFGMHHPLKTLMSKKILEKTKHHF